MATFWKDFLMGNTPPNKQEKGRKDAPKRLFGRTGSLAALHPRAQPERERERDQPRPGRSKSSRDVGRRPPARRREHPPSPPAPAGSSSGPLSLPAERLDKLLDTLTSRELQLSLRLDRADEAIASARGGLRAADEGTSAHESAKRRALTALRRRRALETSLAVTTQQADEVLRALGRRGFVPVEERIVDGVKESREELEEVTAEAEETAAAFQDAFVDGEAVDEEDFEQEFETALGNPPEDSEDWVEEQSPPRRHERRQDAPEGGRREERGRREGGRRHHSREKDERRQHSRETDERRQHSRENDERAQQAAHHQAPARRDRRQEHDHIDPRVAHAGDPGATAPVMPEPAGRPSLERLRAKIPKGASFSRRRRGEKRR